MAHGGRGGQLGKGGAGGVGHVGYLTGMVIGICALMGLFWLPFKYPKAFFATVGIMLAFGVIAWFLDQSNALDNPGSAMWLPVFGIAYWVFRRFMAPKDK